LSERGGEAKSRAGRSGIVYLVGAGPGDPDLITVRGRARLEACDAVVFDALANPAFIDVARAANPGVEIFDAGKRGGEADQARQSDIDALLIRLAHEGKRVVRLKGGDPFVFGRGAEEAQALAREGIAFEIVPGVTAGIAAPAFAGIPVTHRGVATSVTFVTGHEDPTKEDGSAVDWAALARTGGTIVLYMGVKKLPEITASLIAGGMSPDTPAAAVAWGSYPRQQTIVGTLATLADRAKAAGMSAPAITIIGDVVGVRDDIAWFDKRPLFGRRIVVTRAQAQAASLADRLRDEGAEVLEMPATRIEPLDPSQLSIALRNLSSYDWVVFTSQNAVGFFWSALRAAGLDARALHRARVAAIGPATAQALVYHGVAVDVTPERFVAEGLLDVLHSREDIRGKRVLYLAAEGARDVLPAGLQDLEATVDVVPIYRSVPDGHGGRELREQLERDLVDLVTFTSASSVQAFVSVVGLDAARRAPAASIGPETSGAARAAGLEVRIEAAESTIPGLVAAIVAAKTREEGMREEGGGGREERP
jgi:uroporphyrinogen III methyltransferase/synthase